VKEPITIEAKFNSVCKSCDAPIEVGEPIKWVPGVGAWHETCKPPRSLDMYQREAERKRKLGLT
jgi:hypothetical protein